MTSQYVYDSDLWKLHVTAPVPYVYSLTGSIKWTYVVRYKDDGKLKNLQRSGFTTWEEAAEARATKMNEMGLTHG